MVQKLKVKNSVSYGTGQYDSQAHGGKGKNQKLLWPAVGTNPSGPTPNTTGAPVHDATHGKGGPKRGYQTDAHSGLHHGKGGEAVGHKSDLHMDYDKQLYSEGRGLAGEGMTPGWVPAPAHGTTTKAAHHPPVTGVPHKFSQQPAREAHGYGHGSGQRSGHLRTSGHSRGHQVGKRSPQ